MHLKTGCYILLASLLLTGLASCLGSADEIEYVVSTDAQVTSFSIQHDSIPSLALARFSIDQVKGEIYNYDSLPYLTDIYEAVKVTYTTGSGLAAQLKVKYDSAEKDTALVASGDSLNLANLVNFTIFAPNLSEKTYTIKINIHQVDPDSVQYQPIAPNVDFLSLNNKVVRFEETYYAFVKQALPPTSGYDVIVQVLTSTNLQDWEKMESISSLPANIDISSIQTNKQGVVAKSEDGKLYISSDVLYWNEISTVEPVKTVLGYLSVSGALYKEGLAIIVEKDGKNTFAFLPELYGAYTNWSPDGGIKYGETIPANFPISGFSTINNKSLILEKITLVGGKNQAGEVVNTVWATEDGLHWAELSNNPAGNLPLIEGGNAFIYNNELWFTGGKTAEGYNKEVYYSVDGGLVWKTKATKTQAPEEFSLRQGASVVTDSEGKYFYIVGGLNQTDIWKVALNSKLFAH